MFVYYVHSIHLFVNRNSETKERLLCQRLRMYDVSYFQTGILNLITSKPLYL